MERDYKNRNTAIHLALSKQDFALVPLDIITLLISYGGKDFVYATNRLLGLNPLHLICIHGTCAISTPEEAIDALCAVGGKDIVFMKSKHGFNSLFSACSAQRNSLHIVQKLINIAGRGLVNETRVGGQNMTSILRYAIDMDASDEVIENLLSLGGK